MSKIIITGSAIVLKSELTLDTIQKLAKYRPAALEKRDEYQRLLFKVAVASEGNGSITDKAVFFAPVTHDAEKKATVTLQIPESVKGDVKEYAADLLAAAFNGLNDMEASMSEASSSVDAAKAAMLENITVQ